MGFFDKWKERKAEEERKAAEWRKTLHEIETERDSELLGAQEAGRDRSTSGVMFSDDWLNQLKDQIEREKGGDPSSEEQREAPDQEPGIVSEGGADGSELEEQAAGQRNDSSDAPQKATAEAVLQRPALGDRFNTLFSSVVGKAFANQQSFARKIAGNKDWFVDFEKEIIDFEGQEFPVQLLGSESDELNTWLWIWANESPLPDAIKEDALACRKYGEEHDLSELTTASIPLTEHLNGHMLTILSASICERDACYYRAPYEGGAAFILVKDLPKEIFAPVDALTFANLCTQIISAYAVDHKKMVEGFLRGNGCSVEWKTEQRLSAKFQQGDVLSVEFDIYGRIKSMNAEE